MDQLFYEDLVPTRNMMKPKFMELLRSVIGPGLELGAVTDSLVTAFDLDNAAGIQLDILGDLLGLSRVLNVVGEGQDPVMNDEEYRFALRMKALKNNWDGTNQGVAEICRVMAEYGISVKYTDNQNLTVSFDIDEEDDGRMEGILSQNNILPVPAGVDATVSYGGVIVETGMFSNAAVTGYAIEEQVEGIVEGVSE